MISSPFQPQYGEFRLLAKSSKLTINTLTVNALRCLKQVLILNLLEQCFTKVRPEI